MVALVPGAIVTLVAVVFILLDVFHNKGTSREYQAYFAAIGLVLTAASCWYLWDMGLERPVFFGMLYLDRYSLFFSGLACASAALMILASPAFLRSHQMDRGEYYLLILISVAGMIFMVQAADLLTMFIAFEVMSIPLYVLASFLRKDSRSAEAGMKYFILGAFSAALMLYGIALIYGATGTTNLEYIRENLFFLSAAGASHGAFGMVMIGVLLILSGLAFKVAAFPFHIWAPDVYTGSPTPSVGFMATAVKVVGFATMIRVFSVAFPLEVLRGGFFGWGWIDVAFVFAIGSMLLGNLVAVTQDNVKRMLAYYGIAHAGYLSIGFVAANSHPSFFLHNDAILYSLTAYTVALVGAFGVLSYFGRRGEAVETYADLGQLGIKYPKMGMIMTICVLSLAGVPPTGGFLAKFYIFRTGVDVGVQTGEMAFIYMVIVGVIGSVIGAYYYLKVIVYMYMKPALREVRPLATKGKLWALGACAAATLYLGVFPAKPIDVCRSAIMSMSGVPAEVQATIDRGQMELDRRLQVDED